MRPGSLVLCYHAVSDRWTDALAVGPAMLERQVRLLLRRGLRPVRAEEALARSRRTFHVTFDDAYRNLAGVLPALERLEVPVTIFAASDYADTGRRFLVPELQERQGAFPEELDTMPWETLIELAERGVEIGSHTVSHPHLPQLDDAALRRELVDSRERIEAVLGRACRFLAYPYGEDDPRVHRAAEAAGYEAAFSLRGGADHGRFALPRVDIYRRDNLLRFAAKTTPIVRRPLLAIRDR